MRNNIRDTVLFKLISIEFFIFYKQKYYRLLNWICLDFVCWIFLLVDELTYRLYWSIQQSWQRLKYGFDLCHNCFRYFSRFINLNHDIPLRAMQKKRNCCSRSYSHFFLCTFCSWTCLRHSKYFVASLYGFGKSCINFGEIPVLNPQELG